jgi:hypothetical protein
MLFKVVNCLSKIVQLFGFFLNILVVRKSLEESAIPYLFSFGVMLI